MSTTQIGLADPDGYDFNKSENAARWKGLFIPSLKKVLDHVHPKLPAQEEAIIYVETKCLRVLEILCTKPLPHTVKDVEEKIQKYFPTPIDCCVLHDAKETTTFRKRKYVLPTDRIHSLLQKEVLQYKIDSSVTGFIVAILEYISADILKLAGNYVRRIKHCEITKEDVEVALCADRVLMDMFYQSHIKANVVPSPLPALPAQLTSTTYLQVVKELIHDEKQYQRDLHLIIRVFREELVKIVRDIRDLDSIFSNIFEIYELTVTLLGSLEDVIEMSQEQSTPCVGNCFEELAEAEEFNIYTKYAHEVSLQYSKNALGTVLSKSDAQSLMSAGRGFRDAVKYYLPKLLLLPVWHVFVYFEYIKLLIDLSPSQDDIESFEQVLGLLHPIRCDLENIIANFSEESFVAPIGSRARRQLANERTAQLHKTVEHWDKDVGQNCNEFVREDKLGKLGSGKRIAERKMYLFDGLMVLCKANTKRQAPSAGVPTYDFRLKEKFYMRHVEINDRADTDELKNSFEIIPRVHTSVILTATDAQHKNDLMADLIMISTKSMLDRILDSILIDIEKKHPLRMPSPSIYKFAVPDSLDNIVLEERESAGVPLIKGATLCKLIERLTYHIYADPMFVRTFLTTYRYFCSPQDLLSLLIDRFDIPDPSQVYLDTQLTGDKDALNCDTDKMHKNAQREDWKRYRKEYVQPVQFRVLNVLRHWVDHHFYDFEKDTTLLEKLLHFLENVNGKSMRKWVDSVLKIVQRKREQEKSHKQITYAYGHSPPPIEYYLNVSDADITLLTLHPLELARQLTLLEFEMYKNVKPSELVGSPWTKKDKEVQSPNLLKIMKHTTNVTRWIEKSIIEAENYEERVAMVQRAIEVMMVMLELNNFNGILSISAAMGSASVFRLKMTFQGLPARYEKFLEECRELNDGHLKKYQERLRSINPPCVPFFGRYLTNILHLEEGNPDLLPNTELINFSKRRKVAEIIGEIQQYQNQPYCLSVESKIRNFLENLDPFKGMSDTDISNFLYNESLRIEPRGCKQPPKFSRKWASVPLKSPGIKPRRQNNANNNSNPSANVSMIQSSMTFGTRTPTQTVCDPGEQSPTGSQASHVTNSQAYSTFANVMLPERNGSSWVQPSQSAAGTITACTTTPKHKVEDQQYVINGDLSETVPQLPKKPNAMSSQAQVWSGGGDGSDKSLAFSPTFLDKGSRLDTVWNMPDEQQQQQQQQQHQLTTLNNNTMENEHDPLPSPLPKLVVSPRQDLHSSGNRSPFQNTISYSKLNCSPASHFSPTESITSGNTLYMSGGSSPKLGEIDINNPTVVPVSPHVNVPTTGAHVEYRTAPPPLPPRRKERTDSCVEMAQKRQAPDAPTLPPRDGELSPPPIPPRLNHSIGTYPRSQTNEFMGGNSLLLPNTSSIMIRRNSAIEKRSQGCGGVTAASSGSTSASGSSSSSLKLLAGGTLSCPPLSAGHLNASNVIPLNDDQAISPALSSSTASPMTPMTPISPHIPTGYQISENSYHQNRYKSSPTSNVSTPQQQHLHLHHHHHHLLFHNTQHLQQQHQHQLHHLSTSIAAGSTGNNLSSGGGSVNYHTRSSPKEFFPNTEGTPKLPPKPSLSGNFYNNSDKGTMFLYPSTKQE